MVPISSWRDQEAVPEKRERTENRRQEDRIGNLVGEEKEITCISSRNLNRGKEKKVHYLLPCTCSIEI